MTNPYRLLEDESPLEEVNNTIESAEYHITDTIHHRKRLAFMGAKHVLYSDAIYWVLTMIIAVITALITSVMHFGIEYFSELRLHMLEWTFASMKPSMSSGETSHFAVLAIAFLMYAGVLVIFTGIASLCIYWAVSDFFELQTRLTTMNPKLTKNKL